MKKTTRPFSLDKDIDNWLEDKKTDKQKEGGNFNISDFVNQILKKEMHFETNNSVEALQHRLSIVIGEREIKTQEIENIESRIVKIIEQRQKDNEETDLKQKLEIMERAKKSEKDKEKITMTIESQKEIADKFLSAIRENPKLLSDTNFVGKIAGEYAKKGKEVRLIQLRDYAKYNGIIINNDLKTEKR